MAMNSYRVIKRLDVFEYESISMMIVAYAEAIQPFPLNQSVERLDAGVVVRIAAMRIASLHLLSSFSLGF